MPLYMYVCEECQQKFETRHSYRDVLRECILCGSTSVKKDLSSVITKPKINNKSDKKTTGSEVIKAIEEGKEELSSLKKDKTGRVYRKK
jgi:putative FmdB family regulatory protein